MSLLQVLRIEENGNICMEISSTPLLHGSKGRRDSGSDKSESPVVPVVREHNNGGKVRNARVKFNSLINSNTIFDSFLSHLFVTFLK